MKKILLIGKTGQIGSNLAELCDCEALSRDDLDLARPETVYSKLKNHTSGIIINAAAYTAVDLAEDEKELCDSINHLSVAEIARFCADTGAVLVHYSTDYVFDGSGTGEFSENNTENLYPLNHYGATKLAGEKAIIKSGCRYLILRTSWVYNHSGKNFVKTILKLAAEKEELRIISDQVGSPTYAYDIASATLQMLDGIRPGIYHLVPREKISWYQFANMIVRQAKELGLPLKTKHIIPIPTAEYPTKARRPLNSRLSSAKLQNNYAITLPPIAESLHSCLRKVKSGDWS